MSRRYKYEDGVRLPNDPDVFLVSLSYHPSPWSNGTLPVPYTFKVTGGNAYTGRWAVDSIYADKPAPKAVVNSRVPPELRMLLMEALAKATGKEISPWPSDMLAWGEE